MKYPLIKQHDKSTKYSSVHWRQTYLHMFALYDGDKMIAYCKKEFHHVEKGLGMMKQIYNDTYLKVYELDTRLIEERKIKIHVHNRYEEELPQIDDIVDRIVRDRKIHSLINGF